MAVPARIEAGSGRADSSGTRRRDRAARPRQVVPVGRHGRSGRPRRRRLDRPRRDGRAARAERRRQVDDDRHAARPGRARRRHVSRCSARRRPPRSAAGRVGAMLQTGALLRDLTVRELIAMMASLYPRPLDVDEVLELTGIAGIAGQRTQKLSGGQTQRVRFALALVSDPELLVLDEPTVGDGRRGPPRVLDDDARLRGARQDGPVRDALPRGGRRLRRPRRADGARPDRRRRPADRDQGDGRLPHDPGDAARTPRRTELERLPGVTRAERRGEAVVLAVLRLRRAIRALLERFPAARDIEITGAGLEEAFLQLTARRADEAA